MASSVRNRTKHSAESGSLFSLELKAPSVVAVTCTQLSLTLHVGCLHKAFRGTALERAVICFTSNRGRLPELL